MPHNRTPKPGSKWYLPKYEYRHVAAFCLTYNEMRKKLAELNGWHSHPLDGMPHGTTVSSPTENEALERMKLQQKIMLIEQATLMCAGKTLYLPMLLAITRDDTPLWKLKQDYYVPMGKNQFSTMKRQIFYTIAKQL